MPSQRTLFDDTDALTPEAAAKYRARRNDPESSKRAASAITESGVAETQLQHCVDLVFTHPGRTSKELATCSEELDRYQIARRLPEAERRGLVKRDETGELRWFPVDP